MSFMEVLTKFFKMDLFLSDETARKIVRSVVQIQDEYSTLVEDVKNVRRLKMALGQNIGQ